MTYSLAHVHRVETVLFVEALLDESFDAEDGAVIEIIYLSEEMLTDCGVEVGIFLGREDFTVRWELGSKMVS